MEQAILVARQVFLIFLYVGIGILCAKRGILDEKAGRSLSNFTLGIIMPMLLVRNYIRPMDAHEFRGMAVAFGLALVFHMIATAAAVLLIRKRDGEDYKIERLGVVFSNCGYMAIPLIRVACGETGVFYALGYISVFNIGVWTLGAAMLSGKGKMDVKKAILNPGVIGFLVGICFYLLRLRLPDILLEAMDGIVVMNTPLPMITAGVFLAGIKVRETFRNLRIYTVSLLRLAVLPLVMVALLKLSGIGNWLPGAHDIVLAIGLGCACPCAATTTLLPARFGLNGEYGAELIAVTTLFSIVTLPLITLLIKAWF